MTILFKRIRTFFHVCIFLLAAAVLGLSAYFADVFLPKFKRGGFVVYSLAIPAATLLFGLFQMFWAEPRTEALFLFVAGVLWLAQAAWASDQNTDPECFALGGTQMQANHGFISARSFCYESKVVEALSWTIFLLLAIFLVIVITQASKSKVLGHPNIWYEPIEYLPWFGELPGYPGGRWYGSPYHMYHHRYGYGQPMMPQMQSGGALVNIGGHTVQQLPGHSLVIRPSANGGPPDVQQVRGMVQSM